MKQRGFRQHMTNLSIAWSISNHHWQKIVSNRSILHVGKLLDWIKLHEREKKKKHLHKKRKTKGTRNRHSRPFRLSFPMETHQRRSTDPFDDFDLRHESTKIGCYFFSLLFCGKLRNIVILFLRWFFFSPILFERKLWIRSVKCWQNINE